MALGETANARIELLLLGGVDLRGTDRKAADRLLAQPRLVALLVLLALSPDQRPQRRDRIVALLWPELDQAHARTALRKSVHALRAMLGTEALLARGDEEIGFRSPPMWCDAAKLVLAFESGKMMRAQELRRALNLLARIGDRAGALRLYDQFAERMLAELDARPSAETVALAETLRSESDSGSPPVR